MSQSSTASDSNAASTSSWNEILISACEFGLIELAQFCIDKGADVDYHALGRQEMTPLHIASAEGHLEVASLLLSKGAQVDSEDLKLRTPLNYASFFGHIDIVRFLHNSGANINHKDHDNQTPLHTACLSEMLEIVQYLVGNGCSPSELDNKKNSPLHLACRKGNSEIVECLILGGSNPNLVNEVGLTPLLIACFNNHVDTVMTMIEVGVDPNSQTVDGGLSALHYFAQNDSPELVDYLAKMGGNVNSQDNLANRPLHYACGFGNLEVAKRLINAGADPKAFNAHAQTPLHCACQSKDKDLILYLISEMNDINIQKEGAFPPLYFALSCDVSIVDAMIKAGADINFVDSFGQPLFYNACQLADPEVVNLFIKGGVDPNGAGFKGETHLQAACRKGSLEVIKILVESGADVNSSDDHGVTPLHTACREGRLDVVKYLYRKISNPEQRNNNGETPLITACRAGELSIIKFLVANQADIIAVRNDGSTVLHVACCGSIQFDSPKLYKELDSIGGYYFRDMAEEGPINIIKYLILNGADKLIDQLDHQGRSCLDFASKIGHTDVVSLLIRFGANVEKIQPDHDSPLMYASIAGHKDIVRMLINEGANVNKVDIEGFTPLHFACAKGHLDIVKDLLIHGADPGIMNDVGETALELAERRKHMEITALLQSFAADPNAALSQLKDDFYNVSEENPQNLLSGDSSDESVDSPLNNTNDAKNERVAEDPEQLASKIGRIQLSDNASNEVLVPKYSSVVTNPMGNDLPKAISSSKKPTVTGGARPKKNTAKNQQSGSQQQKERDDDGSRDVNGADGGGSKSVTCLLSKDAIIKCHECEKNGKKKKEIRADNFPGHLFARRTDNTWCDSFKHMKEYCEQMRGWTRIRSATGCGETFSYSLFSNTAHDGKIGKAIFPFCTKEKFNFHIQYSNGPTQSYIATIVDPTADTMNAITNQNNELNHLSTQHLRPAITYQTNSLQTASSSQQFQQNFPYANQPLAPRHYTTLPSNLCGPIQSLDPASANPNPQLQNEPCILQPQYLRPEIPYQTNSLQTASSSQQFQENFPYANQPTIAPQNSTTLPPHLCGSIQSFNPASATPNLQLLNNLDNFHSIPYFPTPTPPQPSAESTAAYTPSTVQQASVWAMNPSSFPPGQNFPGRSA